MEPQPPNRWTPHIPQVFPWLLACHGTSDYTARSLSNGKFTTLVPTRSIVESVSLTHLIQQIREQHIDLDATAEALHRTAGNVPPAKTTEAKAFMQPLMDLLLAVLREHAPAPAEGSAIRQLHTREAELQRAKEKLEAHGLHPPLTTRGSPSLCSSRPPRGTSGTTSRDRTRTANVVQVLQPDRPTLKDDVCEKWHARDIANWVKQFDDIIQESATAIIKLLQTSGATENQLQEAAVRYGIPLLKVPKLSVRTLQQLVAIGAAMAC